ncbi:hypothetical protein [Stenotrophomonas maltophilia]|uniref:hypothetical protein n=1 Tax=Stenotrophomonas maltophilia TaxID=40324 RepID=UPI0012FD27AA|nr:hypothetical protein [Stenotrophomonas maltophilia]
MARIRSIKPELWTDERLTECSLSARLLFIGLLNFADDNGNQVYSAKRIKMQVFPADNIETQPLIEELITHGLLIEYSVSGEKYLNIKGFKKHQVINRPTKSNIPGIPLNEDSVSAHGALIDGKEGKGEEGKGEKKEQPRKRAPARSAMPADFGISARVRSWASEKGHDRLDQHLESFRAKAAAKGYTYADWDAAFMEAIRENWAKLPTKVVQLHQAGGGRREL